MNKLTPVQSELLKILESFMHDKPYELPEDFHDVKMLEQLFKLAQVHSIAPVVFEQIRREAVWTKEEFRGMFAFFKKLAVREVMLQMQRADGFLNLYEKLQEAGIRPLVIKGIICRNLYSKSDYRISGDEDILLPREQFEQCDAIMLAQGFSRENFAAASGNSVDMPGEGRIRVEDLPYEIPYINRQNGTYIELHFSLFPEESGAYGHLNDEFASAFAHSVCEEIQGKKVYTLCPTEHLFYLICHSFKHFLHSGFGVRQLADMIMMAEQQGSQIDWKHVEEKLVRLNMKKYWDALVCIGVEYLGFSLEKAGYPMSMYDAAADYEPLLSDLLDSGIYGDSSTERKHSSNMTLTAAAAGKANTAASIGSSLFPEVSYMKKSFPWLERYAYLLPIAYGMRIFRYLKNRSVNQSSKESEGMGNVTNSVQIGIGRVELLRKYDIIE